jgi:putative spermidine/putrescine transport system permease protein
MTNKTMSQIAQNQGMQGMKKSPASLLPYLLLFPAVAAIILLYLQPFLASFWRSFITKEGVMGWQNYELVMDRYLQDIWFTFAVTIFSTAVSTLLSILLAVYIRLSHGWLQQMVAVLYRLPIFLPFVVIAQMMRSFLAPHGILNLILAQLNLIDIENPLQLFNWIGLSFGFIWKEAPFMVLLIVGGFQMIDDSYIEAARSVGASLFQVITRVLIPMNKQTILVAVTLVFCSFVGCFSFPYMLIGGKTPATITIDIAHRVNYFRDYGVANALGVFTYIMVSVLAVYYVLNMRKGLYD